MTPIREIAKRLAAKVTGPEALVGRCRIPAAQNIVTHDSRRVVTGGLFVAVRGAHADGNRFIDEALQRGAVAILSEEEVPTGWPAIWLQVANARRALAEVASIVHGAPASKLALVGVTGTNGKTTTVHLVNAILAAAGKRTALMGTIGYRIADELEDAPFTTPEAPEIEDFLRRAVEAQVTHALMEVSSIALSLHRADELPFRVAAFSNLTQDHLDFHGTMESYFDAKCRLFDGRIGKVPEHAVINLDDPYGRRLLSRIDSSRTQCWTYGIVEKASGKERGTLGPLVNTTLPAGLGLSGLRFEVETPRGRVAVDSPLVGRPHASNLLCAITIALALEIEPEVIAQGIRSCPPVTGRFERVSTRTDDVTVIVDYAHTPDALGQVLQTLRTAQVGGLEGTKRPAGRVWTIFGCGGDRDRSKRPLMGEEAARSSDLVLVTSDNPRSEDPLRILNDIRVGLDRIGKEYRMVVDRRQAIFTAISEALPDDVILIAGKGHETYQLLPTGSIHFDDREVAAEALAERRSYRGRFPKSGSERSSGEGSTEKRGG
jgi:UDP-N-acetylmuramoyl-L-alanyl-D-glutamate--2,6-diaminopimelate ligase